jgi:HEAT repeat protein
MRMRFILLGALICVAIAVTIRALAHQDPQPQYKGKPLSYWVLRGLPTSWRDTQDADAEEAVTKIGTNGLHFLLKWLHYEHPAWTDTLARHTPDALERLVRPLTQPRAELLAYASAHAFYLLGTNAVSAVTDLTALMRDTSAPETADRAIQALGWIGTNSLPALLAAVQDPQYPLRWSAVTAIASIPATAGASSITGPILINCLADTKHPRIPATAANWLRRNLYAPDIAVPALARALSNPSLDEYAHLSAVRALTSFGSNAASALPALTNALAHPSPRVRTTTSNAIWEISTALATNVPPR